MVESLSFTSEQNRKRLMDYSIVIPVFNREELTRNCLATLLPTLAGAGEGEVIVVDNGSRPQTAAMLAAFPWARVLRNDTNRGFAAACNQGARAAAGRLICHLNNDTVAQRGWLANMIARVEPGVGIVGARLFFPDNTIQHAGVAMCPTRFGYEGFSPYHLYAHWARTTPVSDQPADFEIVTGACLLTPRDLFLELEGFDEVFWNGNEDVDYCLRVRQRGLRVVYEPSATLYHYEPFSGVHRQRRLSHNIKTLAGRWAERVEPDQNRFWPCSNRVRRETFIDNVRGMEVRQLPAVTIVVHGETPVDASDFVSTLSSNRISAANVVWIANGVPPEATRGSGPERAWLDVRAEPPLAVVGELLAGRGDRYVAFVGGRTRLERGWLDELVNVAEYGSEVVAATVMPEEVDFVEPCAADARCTLLNLRELPLHIRFADVDTVDGAIVDLTWQAVQLGLGVRAVRRPIAVLPAAIEDAGFVARHGVAHDVLRRPDVVRMETACADHVSPQTFASIVMLSWNAPDYTRMAVDSIRAHTRSGYEIIIVDNGSGPETLAMLDGLADVRLICNATNRGFAHGCNQGMAAARGTHVVLLNNDVVVTSGWLENLLDAHRRDQLVGVSAPRSNRIVGHQQLGNVTYDSLETMQEFAAVRTREFAGMHYRTNRAIGFCLCIARQVIDEVGGIDPRYGVGNFEDDDYCIRVRAAGYQIAICEDVFIHHFGSVSFTANKVDYTSQMQKNWQIFAARWALPRVYPSTGYDSSIPIAQGFVRTRDYVPIAHPAPAAVEEIEDTRREYATAFVAVVDGEAAWSRLGPVVTNYMKALSVDDSSLFAIAVTGASDAATIGARIARSIDRLRLDQARVADIDVADIDIAGLEDWVAAIPAAERLRVSNDERLADLAFAADRSPSGLARTVRGEKR
jgi:GT2 family glycosyltransferase